MRWSRRDALKGAAGAAMGVAAGQVPSWAAPAAVAATNVEFEFTGLFAIQHWTKTYRKAGVLLVRNKEHSNPQLLIRVADVQSTTLPDFQIVRLGGQAYYLWNLVDRLVWVHDVQSGGYDQDSQTALGFNSSAEWETAKNFAPLAAALGKKNVQVKKHRKVTAKILLTQGDASGVKPELDAEYRRRYRLCGDADTSFKKYTSQLRVLHPVKAGNPTLTLKVAAINGNIDKPLKIGNEIRTIVLNTPANSTTHVGLLNGAASYGGHGHFHEFFDLVSETVKGLQYIPDDTGNPPAACMDNTNQVAADSPFVGCIPPILSQDA